jgi:uncharacterized membrane protein YqgA involved in biofilm formation
VRGVLANVATVVIGSGIGLVFGHLIPERFRTIAFKGLGLATLVLGAKMALETDNVLILIGSLVIGAILGEWMRIEDHLESFGHFLQRTVNRTPVLGAGGAADPSRREHTLVEGFVTASLLFCVGPMTILGSIQDGLGDPALLYVKALLDGFASLALATTLGVGVAFSIIPIIVIQGGLALSAQWVEPLLTDAVIREFTAVGGALILAIGLDMLKIKRLPYGNMLPAIVIAGVLAYFVG